MRKFFLAMLVFSFLISQSSLAFAQIPSTSLSPQQSDQKTEPATVATVNIRDANINKQYGNILNVSFAITNRVGFQPQVRYAVDVLAVKENGLQILVDRKVYDETLALNEGERVEKAITYTAPEYLNGTYQVWIVSMNEQSMPFAQALAGEASFSGAGEVVAINQETCHVFISDKPAEKYFIDQGVDISKEENLALNCVVENNTNSTITVTPYFRTHFRSSLGAVVSQESGKDAIVFQGKDKKSVSITLPIASEPQAYDVVVFFVDASGKQVSSVVNTHYVLRGASATIQSIILDKDYYAKGDAAKISLFWTGAADAFPDARGEGTTIGPVDISAVISNAAGKECGSVLSKADTGGVSTLNTSIVIDCASPIVSLSVTDKTGKVLAKSQFGVQTKTQIKTVGIEDQNKNNMGREGIFTVVLIVALLFVIAFFFYQKRKSKNKGKTNTPTSTQLFVFVFLLLGSLFPLGTARADTFFVGYDGVFTVNLNKDVYAPGEAIHVTGSGTGGICGNGRQALALYTWNNQSPQVIFPPIDDKGVKYGDPNNPNDPLMFSNHSYKIQTVYSTKNFVAPTTQGPYRVSFTGVGRSDLPNWPGGHGPLVNVFYYLPYSVTISPVNGACNPLTNGIATATKPTINLCSTTYGNSSVVGTGPWNWSCFGFNGGVSTSCSAPIPNQPPNKPTVTDSFSSQGLPGVNYQFTATATDQEGNLLRYGFDWDNNAVRDPVTGVVTGIDGWTGYVSSGTSQSDTKGGTPTGWSRGTHTIKVVAQDDQGANHNSPLETHTFTIQCPQSETTTGCDCAKGTKTHTILGDDPSNPYACINKTDNPECSSSEKNSCRDFNWKEVAP
jgi:hypothetical protein